MGMPSTEPIRQALNEPNKKGKGAPTAHSNTLAASAAASVANCANVIIRWGMVILYPKVYNPVMDTSSSQNQAITCYRDLIARLQSGAVVPGDYLREQLLAEEFGVSRTPVREALRKLETEGLLVSEPRLGMRVRALDYTEVIELYEVRLVHERAVARIAAAKVTDVELLELKDIQAAFEKTKNNAGKMAGLNQKFHFALLQTAKNRFLTRAVESMQRSMLLLGPSTLNDTKRANAAIKEHRGIIQALEKRDADKAEDIMSMHLQNAQRSRIRQYQENPWHD